MLRKLTRDAWLNSHPTNLAESHIITNGDFDKPVGKPMIRAHLH